MSEAPDRIWFAPNEAELSSLSGWAGVVSGKDRLYFECDLNHHPDDDDVVPYVRADRIEALEAENRRLREALEALVLNIDAGGATLGAMADARAALSTDGGKE